MAHFRKWGATEDTVRTLVTTVTNQVTLYMYKSLKIWKGGLKPPKKPWCLHPCNSVKYEESVWMKVRSEREREALYMGCVYICLLIVQ